jgi:hypothetical protein
MPHNLALILALAVPFAVMALLRINAAMVFLSLCLGAVMVQYVAGQADDLFHAFVPHAGNVSTTTLSLALLLAPAVMTAVLTVFSVHGGAKVWLNFLPAAAAAALATLLTVPLLPAGIKHTFESQSAWHVVSSSEALVIGVGGFMSLVFLWSQRRFFKSDKHGR